MSASSYSFLILFLVVALSLVARPALSDVLRISCGGILSIGRVDPVISPGAITSNHAHVVYGAFSPSVRYEQLFASECPTCEIVQDNSAYWFPTLYWHNSTDGSYTSVPQVSPDADIYYLQRQDPVDEPVVAFPPGFRMIAGSMSRRTPYNAENPQFVPPVNCVCLNYYGVTTYTYNFPNVTCVDGLRAQLNFPSCWDGVNLDSPTHNTHVSYAVTENLNSGPCPSSHPVRIPAIFTEVIWSTAEFGHAMVDGESPFVWSFATPTTLPGNEYGYHGGQHVARTPNCAGCPSLLLTTR